MGPGSIAASVRSVFSGDSHKSSRETEQNGRTRNGSSKRSPPTEDKLPPQETDDSEESSSEESEDDEESMFTYTRVTKLPPSFFRKDKISACCIHAKLHVYATDSGLVHITTSNGEPIRTVRVHRSSVLDVSVDQSGEYLATASIDGTIMVASVGDNSDTVQANFKRPLHAIALHPDYANARSYVSGGTAGQVVLSERGWLKSRADTVLVQTPSTILALAWSPQGIVWCNDDGITIYDMDTRTVRAQIPRSTNAEDIAATEGYMPRLFVDGTRVIVAWANLVFTVDIKTGQLIQKLPLPYKVAGAVPFHQSKLAVLAVNSESESELKIIQENNGSELYADSLEMRPVDDIRGGDKRKDVSQTVINQYHLLADISSGIVRETTKDTSKVKNRDAINGKANETTDTQLWIINSKDAIVARERNARDHLNWLVEHQKFVEAYQAAKATTKVEIDPEERKELGRQAAQKLVDQNQFEPAAFILSEILDPEDITEWLLWSNQFINAKQSLILGEVIPATTKLAGHVHDTILEAAIDAGDDARLRTWVKRWPLEVYDGQLLGEKLETVLSKYPAAAANLNAEVKEQMQLVYADVLLKLGEYVKSVKALIKANSPRGFRLVSHYHLWSEPEIVESLGAILVAGDGDLGDGGYVDRLRELIAARAEISPTKVVQQLQSEKNQDLLLFGYLSELRLVDESLLAEKPLVDLMIRLYAKYDNHRLLGFLEKFDTYDIDASIAMCRELGLTNELVYLLGRLGQSKEALSLIVTELKDYDRAIAFARTQDSEIWDQLVGYVSQSPGLVLTLLKCVEVSPARVLSMVPADMHIPGLKSALCKVLNGQEVSVALHTGALTIVNDESSLWAKNMRAQRLRGVACDNDEMQEQLQSQANSDAGWKNEPVLVSETNNTVKYQCVEAFKGNVYTLSGKIQHLKAILSRY